MTNYNKLARGKVDGRRGEARRLEDRSPLPSCACMHSPSSRCAKLIALSTIASMQYTMHLVRGDMTGGEVRLMVEF